MRARRHFALAGTRINFPAPDTVKNRAVTPMVMKHAFPSVIITSDDEREKCDTEKQYCGKRDQINGEHERQFSRNRRKLKEK